MAAPTSGLHATRADGIIYNVCMKLACALLLAGAALAQTPADQHPVVVEGKVVNSLTAEAIRKAELTLTTDIMPDDFAGTAAQFGLDNDAPGAKPKPSQPKKTFVAASEASGKFHFENVAPGDYFFTIKHAGFVDLMYRATGENRSADGLLHLKAGQEVRDLEVRLVPEGAAVGRVVDEDGDPVVNVMVSASAVSYATGHLQLQLRDSGTTNDRGEFRLGKLPPGRYYIAAEMLPTEMATPPPPPADGSPETAYVCTYYPKATGLADADLVDVKAGVDSPELSIQLQKSRVVRVKGMAVGADGKPLRGAQIMLMAAGRPFSMRMITANNLEGKFELANVPPGAYSVMIMQLADQKMVQQPLFVPAENLNDVKLGVVPEGTVQGRVNLVGDTKIALKGLPVTLEGVEDSLIMPVNGTTDETGAFALKKVVPASYQFDLSPMPEGAYLKSVLWNGKEKLGEPFDFALGSGAELQVFLATDGGSFDAKVSHVDKPLADATVVLLPADATLRNRATALSEDTDGSGHAAFKDVRPGDYLAIAWEKIEEGDWFDPAVVKAAESSALKVTIGPKDNQHADLKALPPR